MALFVCGIPISNAFAGLISAGILDGMQDVGGLHSWQWLFLIEGLATIVVGVAAFFLLADYPRDTKWLSPDERMVAQARLALEVGSQDALDEEKVGPLRSLLQAAKDYRVWLFACMQMATTASISYSHFFPTLIDDLGFKSHTTTLLLTSPPYVVAVIWCLTCAWVADKKQTRSVVAMPSAMIALIGAIAAVALPEQSQWPRYGVMFLLCMGTYGVYTTTYTWLSSTIVKPPSKRAASIGVANTFANVASFYGNYFWLDKYEPAYKQSWGCIIGFIALCSCCIVALFLVLTKRNKEFDRLERAVLDGDVQVDDANLSEEQSRAVRQGFRYVV